MTADRDVAVETLSIPSLGCPAAPRPVYPPNRAEFLRLLFHSLDGQGVRYCVLHSYQDLPESIHGDLDLAVHPDDLSRIAHIFESLRSQGCRPIQFLNYAVRGFYFVFLWFEEHRLQSLTIDVIVEHRRGGLILASGEHLVSRRRKQGDFWIPDPAVEFAYLLCKKSLKGAVPAHQEQRLRRLVAELGRKQAVHIAAGLVRKRHAEDLVGACAEGSLAGSIGIWKRRICFTALKDHPFTPVRYFSADLFRILRRWFVPTGLFLVVL